MPIKKEGYHKLRAPEEEKRVKQFADFVQRQRWSLGMTQAEVAKRVGCNQSEVARIEKGEHLPRDRYTLEKYADTLKLEGLDRREFFERAGYVVDVNASGSQEELIGLEQKVNDRDELHLQTLYALHMIGNPRLALQKLDPLISDIRKDVRTSKHPKGRLDLLAQALCIKGWLVSAISKPLEFYAERKTFDEAVSFAQELSDIGKELNNSEYLGKADNFRGDAHHVAGHHLPSIEYLKRALVSVKDPFTQVHIHRTLAATYSLLPRREEYRAEFDREVEEIIKLNDSGLIPDQWGIVADEGVARSLARFGDFDEAFKWIQKGQERLDRMVVIQQRFTMRVLNMGKAELFVKKLSQTGHPDDWKEMAQKLIQLDPDQQYPRLIADLRKYL